MIHDCLQKEHSALMVVDVQERLVDHVERRCDMLAAIKKMVKGAQILDLPIWVTEQYPEGLGVTEPRLRESLGTKQLYLHKTSFSALADDDIRQKIEASDRQQWILVGIEAHVCILQTARDFIIAGKQVTVLNDCISSRSLYDYSTAIAELRDLGVRISTAETVLFELLHDSKAPEFKQISQLIKCC